MTQNKFGELVFSEQDVCDLLMSGKTVGDLSGLIVDRSVSLDVVTDLVDLKTNFVQEQEYNCDVQEFHRRQQTNWHMPDEYKNMDIASHILDLCSTESELQRCGAELLLYQERGLFDLLRYLKYLVDVMKSNNIIWGVGRGSSVASYVLYLLGVHRINSMYYNLDIEEFLR
jgi:DNA polymerase III alpha subunit